MRAVNQESSKSIQPMLNMVWQLQEVVWMVSNRLTISNFLRISQVRTC